jgi:hypothetical protein
MYQLKIDCVTFQIGTLFVLRFFQVTSWNFTRKNRMKCSYIAHNGKNVQLGSRIVTSISLITHVLMII